VARGGRASVDARNLVTGDEYYLSLPADALARNVSEEAYFEVFDESGDVTDRGVLTTDGDRVNDSARLDAPVARVYARVVVDDDGGSATARVDTDDLRETDVPVSLARRPSEADTAAELDDDEFEVREATASVEAPDTYVVGTEAAVSGSATEGVEDVAVYVAHHNPETFRLVDFEADAGTNGTADASGGGFDREAVLSAGDAPGNRLLSYPGTYTLGVVPVGALEGDTAPETLPAGAIGPDARHTVTVEPGALSLSVESVGGEVATTDGTLDVSGTATGHDRVAVVLLGARGTVAYHVLEVGSDGNFSVDSTPIDGFAQGPLAVYALGVGRDDRLGDGRLGDDDATLAQMQSSLLSETRDDAGSDDPLVGRRVDLSAPTVTIDNVTSAAADGAPTAGQRLVVAGRTNVDASDDWIEIQVRGRPEVDAVVERWNGSRWRATLDTTGLSPGDYTLVTEVEDSRTTRSLTLVAPGTNRTTPTATPSPTATPGRQSTPTGTPDPSTPDGERATATAAPTPTDEDDGGVRGPATFGGAGLLVALVVLTVRLWP
jgi:major cell surface glycoprotein (TIGR04216 family)